MRTSMTDSNDPKIWNVWWTLAAIGAATTFIAGLLEVFGVWRS